MPFRSRSKRWVGLALFAALAALVLAGCSNSPSVLRPEGPIASKEAGLFWFILIVASIVFVSVTGVLVYSIFRFRARPGSPPPRQVQGNTTLEIAWTVVPSVILFAVLIVTITTMFSLAQPSSGNVITVTAIGHQWWWEFQYPDSHIVTADEMHVPVGTTVHIDLRSDNVIHSFWVPQLGGKTDVIPGHDNSMWLKADTAGTYRGECAEFCGTQHAHMDFEVVAESSSAYQAWVSGQQQYAAQPTSTEAIAGQKLFVARGCAGCHLINQSASSKVYPAQVGPNLTHFGTRQLIAGGVLDNNTTNLRQWIYNAQSIKNGVDMPSFDGSTPTYQQLTPQELDQLVAYLQSLQ